MMIQQKRRRKRSCDGESESETKSLCAGIQAAVFVETVTNAKLF